MTDTGLFKWIWRFNALAIALLVLLALVTIGFELVRNVFPSETTNMLAVAPDNTPHDNLPDDTLNSYFSAPFGNSNGPIYALPLYVEQEYADRGISKSSGGNLVNFRIVQTTPRSNRWLFAPGERLIQSTNALALRQGGTTDLHLGYLLAVTEADTNRDARLSIADTQSLYLTDANWSDPVKVTDGVRGLLFNRPVDANTLDLIYSADTGTHIARVNLTTGAVLSEQIITTQD